MLLQVVVGAVVSLLLLVGIVTLLLRRAPLLFVADKLPENLYSGADEVGELVTGTDGVDEAGFDQDRAGLDAGDVGDVAGVGDGGDTGGVSDPSDGGNVER